jgi:hypothetical protein
MADALQLPDEDETALSRSLRSLSLRRRLFVLAYVGQARGNGREAARLSGYATPAVDGARLIAIASVRACIDAWMEIHSMSTAEITAELTEIARAPMDRFQQLVNEYTSEDGKRVQQIIRQDLNPKVNALKELAQIRGLHAQQIDINVRETRTIVGVNISDVTGRHREIEGTATETHTDIGQDTDTDTDTEE